MELDFEKTSVPCLYSALYEVQSGEQTQQLKLPDGAPDVGQVLGAWGQAVLRGKQWHDDVISVNGGVTAWVLYEAEDGSGIQLADAWLPFQMKWDLPDGTPEGTISVRCRTRFVDARTASARKLVVRAGVAVEVQALAPWEGELSVPAAPPEGVELLQSTYPVRLRLEAGEKTFSQDEELALPEDAPAPEKLIYYRLEPRVTDRKVLSGRVVFRGVSDVHVLYRDSEGRLHSRDLETPFSQYAELEGEYGADAQAQFRLCPTSVELEPDEEGRLRLKCTLAAQYVITDKKLLTVVEDAYSPTRELEVRTSRVELPVLLDSRRETVSCQQTLPGRSGQVVDGIFLPDFPRQRPGEGGVELALSGVFQVLTRGENGALEGTSARWEGREPVRAHENSRLTADLWPGPVRADQGPQGLDLACEPELRLDAGAWQELPVVTGVTLGQPKAMDPERPSLVLRRAGEDRLWDIAKESGSTVEAIRRANALTDEPAPTRMLLIPILG